MKIIIAEMLAKGFIMDYFFYILFYVAIFSVGIGVLCVFDLRTKDKRFKNGYRENAQYNENRAGFGITLILCGSIFLILLNYFNKTPNDYLVKNLQIPEDLLQTKEINIWQLKGMGPDKSFAFASNDIITLTYVCLAENKTNLILLKVRDNSESIQNIHFQGDKTTATFDIKYKTNNGFHVINFDSLNFLTENKNLEIKFEAGDLKYESLLKLDNSKKTIGKAKASCLEGQYE